MRQATHEMVAGCGPIEHHRGQGEHGQHGTLFRPGARRPQPGVHERSEPHDEEGADLQHGAIMSRDGTVRRQHAVGDEEGEGGADDPGHRTDGEALDEAYPAKTKPPMSLAA